MRTDGVPKLLLPFLGVHGNLLRALLSRARETFNKKCFTSIRTFLHQLPLFYYVYPLGLLHCYPVLSVKLVGCTRAYASECVPKYFVVFFSIAEAITLWIVLLFGTVPPPGIPPPSNHQPNATIGV